jgi:hypothetical protein
MRYAVHVQLTQEKRYPYRILMGKIEGKRPLARFRHGQGIKKCILNRLKRFSQAQNRDKWWALVNTVMFPGLQQKVEDSLTS